MANSPYTLFTMPAAGPSLTAGTKSSMLSAAAANQIKPVLPANWLAIGTFMTFDAWGIVTTAATPGSGTWEFDIGSAQQVTSGALVLATSAVSWPWHMHIDLTCRSVGQTSAAQCWVQGYLDNPTSLTAWSHIPLPQTTAALGTGFDSTVPNTCDAQFTETLGTATFVCEMARLIIHNPNF